MKLQCSGGPNDRGIDIQVQVYESRYFLGDLGDRFLVYSPYHSMQKHKESKATICAFSLISIYGIGPRVCWSDWS